MRTFKVTSTLCSRRKQLYHLPFRYSRRRDSFTTPTPNSLEPAESPDPLQTTPARGRRGVLSSVHRIRSTLSHKTIC